MNGMKQKPYVRNRIQSRNEQALLRVFLTLLLCFLWLASGILTKPLNQGFRAQNIERSKFDSPLITSIIIEIVTFFFSPLCLLVFAGFLSAIFIAKTINISLASYEYSRISRKTIRAFLNFYMLSIGKRPTYHIRNAGFTNTPDFARLNQLGGPAEIILYDGLFLIIQEKTGLSLISNSTKGAALNISLSRGDKVFCIRQINIKINYQDIYLYSQDQKKMKIKELSLYYHFDIHTEVNQVNNFFRIEKESARTLINSAMWEDVVQKLIIGVVKDFLQGFTSMNLITRNLLITKQKNESTTENFLNLNKKIPNKIHRKYETVISSEQKFPVSRNRLRRLYNLHKKQSYDTFEEKVNKTRDNQLLPLIESVQAVVNPLVHPLYFEISHFNLGKISIDE